MSQPQAEQILEELYDLACKDIRGLRRFVKENDLLPFYPNTLPPKAQMRQPAPGETVRMKDKIDYLNALVAEADQLTDLLPRLTARQRIPQNLDNYEKSLEFSRCLVRIKELGVDWELAIAGICDEDINEAKRILQEGDKPGILTEDELQVLRDDVKVWEEGLPAVKAAWEVVLQKSTSSTNVVLDRDLGAYRVDGFYRSIIDRNRDDFN
ncbi:hypothetical protein K449DRAFT_420480 [Hypoxylon sp. EC38]|nr:hypothetical protein K449DRAFT_420480 [Hypoxylon sp. EC38]